MYRCENWKLDYKESSALKNWCFWTVVSEKMLESPLDCKEIQPVHPKGDQSWIVIGRTDVEAETPIFWPPDVKSWLIWKDPDVWKDWGQEEKGTTEDEMIGWHHRLHGHEFGWTLGVGDGQGGLASCSPWGHKGSDTTEHWADWLTDYMYHYTHTHTHFFCTSHFFSILCLTRLVHFDKCSFSSLTFTPALFFCKTIHSPVGRHSYY